MGTFSQALTYSAWTAIADGSTDGSFGIQLIQGDVAVFIGDTEPNIDEDQFMILSISGTRELSSTLGTDQLVYARATHDRDGTAEIRGFTAPAA
ncbi:hypothetical protein C8D77_11196 [Mesorhizobium loti]|uniref:Uncharacterized protein n=1 Tax=Rhizobium loti TaxID=381 RepID=A0A8E3B2W7_RHILI|nr:hypothetical protein [Mesorhizobium loti]PWJ88374.1 hypothetical protein C8D77_11196 [Mesorhizobium loti]